MKAAPHSSLVSINVPQDLEKLNYWIKIAEKRTMQSAAFEKNIDMELGKR